MDLYDAWQHRKWRKFKGDGQPFRAEGGGKDGFRITQEDVVVEDNMTKAHELQSYGSREYKQVTSFGPN